MRIVRWGAAAAAALTTCSPLVAEAATSPSTTPNATSGTTAGQTINTATSSAPAVPAPAPTPTAPTPVPAPTSSTSKASTQDTTVTQPAPPGSAEAYAAQVGNVAAVSHTKASASGSGGSATANPLELGGKPPAPQFGGSQDGPGSSKGALFDTGTTPLGRLALTPWTATNSSSASGNTASGLADIVLLDLGDTSTSQSAYVRVLQSQSDASWTPSQSTGTASSDGAIVNVGGSSGLTLDVLHSETSSTGAGSSYLLSINGQEIGSSSQANGQCTLSIPSLLTLNCLTASGGTGITGTGGTTLTSAAGVASATLGSGANSLTAGLIQSTSTSGKAPATVAAASSPPAAAPPANAPAPAAAPAAPAASAARPAASSKLPFTGADIGLLLAAALGLAGAGGGILIMSRRPKTATR